MAISIEFGMFNGWMVGLQIGGIPFFPQGFVDLSVLYIRLVFHSLLISVFIKAIFLHLES